MALVVKSLPGWGRSPGIGHGNDSSILALIIPWPEEPGKLQSIGPQRIGCNLARMRSM